MRGQSSVNSAHMFCSGRILLFIFVPFVQIAQELDELEKKAFMQEGGGLSEEYKAWAADGSGNVAADGMFSIQVSGL